MQPSKTCSKCGESKELRFFYRDTTLCKPCHNAASARWKREHRFQYLAKVRARERRDAGWIADVTDELKFLKLQNSRCAICEVILHSGSHGRALDHNHKTGKARGYLCVRCNLGLSKFHDSPLLMERAAVYLRHDGVGG